MGVSGTTINDVLEPTAAGPKLQCASCHDVHDSAGESIAGTKLLRESMTAPASGLCLTCHLK
jgi:predicted CXXCH cytochrome family protein